jgi:GAF domain-containing protein
MRVRLGTGLAGIAMSVMETVRLDESQSDERLPTDVCARLRGEGLVSLICAPLIQRGELIGTLLVGFQRAGTVLRELAADAIEWVHVPVTTAWRGLSLSR